MGQVRIGTASWTDPTLLASGWYPPEANTPERRLRYYARQFDRELSEWAGKITGLDVDAAVTHVLFNNCYRDFAQVNAQQLAAMLAS
jgi:uncharacterized protein YecE (DUF72 family)